MRSPGLGVKEPGSGQRDEAHEQHEEDDLSVFSVSHSVLQAD